MDIIIEKARPSDAEEIIAFLRQVGGESDNLTFGPEGLALSVEDEAAYIQSLESSPDGIMLLAKANDKIVASASLSRMPRRMGHRGESGITVLREFWNRGIGTRLAGALVDFARENRFDIIDVQVRSDNHASLRLCEKFGFTRLCTYPAFLKIKGENIDAELLQLRL